MALALAAEDEVEVDARHFQAAGGIGDAGKADRWAWGADMAHLFFRLVRFLVLVSRLETRNVLTS